MGQGAPDQDKRKSAADAVKAGRPKGPWELPPEPKPKTPAFRRPLTGTRRGSSRTPMINNWGGLVAVLLLIFVAPIVVGWVSRVLLGLISGGG